MTIHTQLCDILQVKHPVIQGGMAWVATAELAAAVSEGGGLGIIGAGKMTPGILRDEIRKARALTNNPLGVNIVLLQAEEKDDNNRIVGDLMTVVLEERPDVLTTGAGNPTPYLYALKDAGIKTGPVLSSVPLAKRIERAGADFIIVEGMEAGGHVGELTTMVLVPQVVDAVNIPVIAAGGIADGRGLAAALMLGAQGVQVGTRFMCATETQIHPRVKDRILKAGDRDTVLTGISTGHPVRVIKNQLTREFERLDAAKQSEEILERGTGKLRAAMQDGDIEWGSVMAGQIAGMINEIKPAAKIIEEMIKEAEGVIMKTARLLLGEEILKAPMRVAPCKDVSNIGL